MALLTIRLEGDNVLRKVCKKVEDYDKKLKILIDDMIETMHDKNGIGLAASQVGRLKRIITVDLYDETGPKYYINPEIIEEKGKSTLVEACLSIPDRSGYVERPTSIVVKANDIDGNEYEFVAKDLHARVICHEIDHLNGVLFIDKIVEIDDEEET